MAKVLPSKWASLVDWPPIPLAWGSQMPMAKPMADELQRWTEPIRKFRRPAMSVARS